MTPAGWLVMILSISSVTLLFAWCIWKVLTTPGETHKVHGLEQETPDQDPGPRV